MAYKRMLVIEKRTTDGQLDFSQPQPPFFTATEDKLCEYYFRNALRTPENDHSASLETIYGWYNAQGFQIRPKTW